MYKKILLLILVAKVVFGGNMVVSFSFFSSDFLLSRQEGFVQIVGVAEGVPWGNPGEPQIWAVAKHVLLPPGNKARHIRILDARFESFADDVVLFPFQRPAILSAGDPGFTEPDKNAYNSDRWFPEAPAILSGSGSLSGFSIADIVIFPVRYNPVSKKLELLTRITIEIGFSPAYNALPFSRSSRSLEIFEKMVREIVSNPDDLVLYRNLLTIDDNLPDVAIVVSSATFAPSQIERFRLLLNRYAWQDTLIYLSSLPPGGDNAQRIRTAIKNLWLSSGIGVVVLVGDTAYLQHRTAFAMDCEYGAFPDENYIPCDLYFSDLDGDWDFDGDGVYGEVADSIDLYPDVVAGRVSVTHFEMQGWTNKRVAYGENPPSNFAEKFLFLAEVLWHEPFTDAGIGKNMIRDEALPPWADLVRLYETLGNEGTENVLLHLNEGYHIVNHDGHAFTTVMGVGNGEYIFSMDVASLSNFPKCGVLFSIGCWPAAFDYDCIAEQFLRNSDGGVVAFIGNSRYGWGSPGNPGFGYSDYFDRAFYKWAFHKTPLLGSAVAGCKIGFIPYARWENVWRWKVYEINLLGDPTQVIWQGEPSNFLFDFPVSIPQDGGYITFPADTLCISAIQDGVLLSKECGGGTISVFVDPITSAPIEIAISDPLGRKRPIFDTVFVVGEGPYLSIESVSPVLADCCSETTDVQVTIRNAGSFDSFTILDVVSDTAAEVIGFSPSSFDISAGATQNISLSVINRYIDDGMPVDISLRVAGTDTFNLSFRLNTSAPKPVIDSLRFVGDTNIIVPGHTYQAFFFIRNSGALGDTFDVWLAPDENLVVQSDTVQMELPPLGTGVGVWEIFISPTATAGGADLNVEMIGRQASFSIPLWIPILMEQFFDDAEGEPQMIVEEPWHITGESSHSGGHSYKCGPEGGMYEPYTNASMCTPPIILGPNAVFEFWAQYEVPTYGTAGIHIIAHPVGLAAETLAFIGSGGALGLLNFFVGWNKWRFELPEFVGMQVYFEIAFRADENQALGFYIDDISVNWASPSMELNINDNNEKTISPILEVFPNPFNSECVFVGSNNMLNISIYDLYGVLVDDIFLTGCNIYKWKPSYCIRSGILFSRISLDNGQTITKKIILLK